MSRSLFAIVLAAILSAAPPARGAPLMSSRAGGLALVGPATAHPGSTFFNPAALGLLHGYHLHLDTSAQLLLGSAERAPVERATGEPGSSGELLRFDGESFANVMPSFFAAATGDFGLDWLVAGLTVHSPTSERISLLQGASGDLFDAAAQGASRYHGAELTVFQLYATLGAAVRVAHGWYVGASLSYVFSMVDFAFARDAALDGGRQRQDGEYAALDDCGDGAPCLFESDRAAAAFRVRGRSHGLGFAVGLLGRVHPRVDVGVGYVSPVSGFGGDEIPAFGDAWVRRSAAVVDNAGADPSVEELQRDLAGRGTIIYQLPDVVTAGVTWRVLERLTLNLQLRWLNYRRHDRFDIRLTGREFRKRPEVPNQVVHYRGFHDVFAGQLGAAYKLTDRLLLQVATMVESAALSTDAVNTMAIDGWKLDLLLALRWRLWAGLTVGAGYNLVVVPPISVGSSDYHPSYLAECVDSSFNVDLIQCRAAAAGRGLASTAGEYALWTHRFGLSVGYDWW